MKSLQSLQVGRGIAALAVVFHHASISAEAFEGGVPNAIKAVFAKGYLGVDFFFVLSGFIIYYSSHGKTLTATGFIQNRFVRIFIPYLPIGIGLALAYTFLPSLSASDREWGWWASLSLMPTFSPPALSVAWTLQHELVFYAIFGLLISIGNIGLGMAIWSCSILVVALFGVELPTPLNFLFALINLEFGMGVLAAFLLLSGGRLPYPHLLAIIPFAAFFALGADRSLSPLFGAGLAFLILSVSKMDIAERVSVPAFTVFLGAASYSIYLIHNPLLSVSSRIADGWLIALFGGILLSVAVGSAYHLLWERPLQRFFKRKTSIPSTSE